MSKSKNVSQDSGSYDHLRYYITGQEREKELCDLIGLKRLLCPLCGRRFFYKVDVCVADPNDCHKDVCDGNCGDLDYKKSFDHGNQTYCPFCKYDEDKEYFTECERLKKRTKNKNSKKLEERGITRERHEELIRNDYTQRNDRTMELDHISGTPTVGGAQLIVSTNDNINNAGRFVRYRNASHFKQFNSYFNDNKHIKKNATSLEGWKRIIKESRAYPIKKYKGKIGKGCIHPWKGVKKVSWPIPGLMYDPNSKLGGGCKKRPDSYYDSLKNKIYGNYPKAFKFYLTSKKKTKLFFITLKYFIHEIGFRDRIIKECRPKIERKNKLIINRRLAPGRNKKFTPYYHEWEPMEPVKSRGADDKPYKKGIYQNQYRKRIYKITYLGISILAKQTRKNFPLVENQKTREYYLNLIKPNAFFDKEVFDDVIGFLPTFRPKHPTTKTESYFNVGELSGALLTRPKPMKEIQRPFDGWSQKDLILDAISDHIKKCYGWKSDKIKLNRVWKFTDSNIKTSKKIIPLNDQKTSPINMKNTKGKNRAFRNEWKEEIKKIKDLESLSDGEWYPSNQTKHEGLGQYWNDSCWNEKDPYSCLIKKRESLGNKKDYDETHERILKIIKMNAVPQNKDLSIKKEMGMV